NLLAKDLIDHQSELDLDSVCAYTFATPAVTKRENQTDEKYLSIYNFCFQDDFVPQMPLEAWSYGRYGTTVTEDSEWLSKSKEAYNRLRRKIKVKKTTIAYNSAATDKLIKHVGKCWKDVDAYYSDLHTFFNITAYTMTSLYNVMHNYVAPAAAEEGFQIAGITNWQGVVLKENTITPNSYYKMICKYFVTGYQDKSLFGTHHIDNYYAALKTSCFDTDIFNIMRNYSSTRQLKSMKRNTAINLRRLNDSDNIQQFKEFLEEKMSYDDESGQKKEISNAELLGWSLDDITTWEGISFDAEGHIVDIDLPLCVIAGKLDLSGFNKLTSLQCFYTDLTEIDLTGCESLVSLKIPYNRLNKLNLSGCGNLETIDIRWNELKTLEIDSYEHLADFQCTYNYLDVHTNETIAAMIAALEEKGGNLSYHDQNPSPDLLYNSQDMECIRNFLQEGNNRQVLGWNPDDIATWDGVTWKPVGSTNRIDTITIQDKAITGNLDITALEYITELDCSGTNLVSLDVRECQYLKRLVCDSCQLEELHMGENNKLLILYCQNNYLDPAAIGEFCQEVAKRHDAIVYYEEQYIPDGRSVFCEEECRVLESFAANQNDLDWNMDRPGSIPGITWEMVDGKYRVWEIDLSTYEITGSIDLTAFTSLYKVCFATTDIEEVVLPESIREIGEEAFASCYQLQEIVIPQSVRRLGNDAFHNCLNLQKVLFCGDAPEDLGMDIFAVTDENLTIYYYQGTSGWDAAYWVDYHLVEQKAEVIVKPDYPTSTPVVEIPDDVTTQEPIATPDGVSTKKPTATQDSAPTEKPVATQDSIPTEKPIATQDSAPTKQPVATQDSAPTKKPIATQGSIPTKKPATTQDNVSTKKPTAMPGVQTTKQPAITPDVIETMATAQTPAPQTGVKPTEEAGKRERNLIQHSPVLKMRRTKILKVRCRRRFIIITLKRVKGVSGYELSYRRKGKHKYKRIFMKSWKKNKIKLKKLKKGQMYIIRVRTYKKKGQKKYYSQYSKKRVVRVH
ncbi:MAG: leucine-rich repeat protein, partial [Ruminococcus flavefaciens]|nr:leucine-rich repeat protein [Ruminococcus flavefaciens]